MALCSPYYDDGQCVIYCGDCRDILPLMAAGYADLVLTDPPYGISKRHRTFANSQGPIAEWDDEFPTWWMDDAQRIAPVVAVMPGVVNLPRCPTQIGRVTYRWTLAVHVTNGMTRSPVGYGNWIPCVVYACEEVSLYQQASDIGRIAIGNQKPDHPSPKPLEAMHWLVNRLPGQTILDPFMGAGSTLRAAKDLGRRAIGIEISEDYCRIAVERLRQSVLPLGTL